ncbi:gliding motility lipoprotein GldD [Pedobacter changchengzhani]|uniref:Gliding motility lipoprotein GldD n=1 Tax=Pedobacter changchengzhani TaxID=2529274 RepID=A0A4R5MPB3_9SPHI|nr:gliding motility lipoprotein GldD [Pedobacter changchengzhani]TDG37624.1 gliding motility lipoprotein GldD [Pedobacter changchengzhani]
MKAKHLISALILMCVFFMACKNNTYSPKPKGYFRINFPEKKYQTFNGNAPFTFEYPVYARLEKDSIDGAERFWYNLHYTQFNGYLHLTYYDVNQKNKYTQLVEDARTLAYKHTVKASSIDRGIINYPDKKVYGVYYAIEGNTASSFQFFLTDSLKHYFRGALYFNERPQYDSIEPVVKFIKTDLDKMISTFKWKN